MKTYNIRVTRGGDGWLVAQAQNLRGAITQGRDLDEVAFMIRDAIELLTQTRDFAIVLRLDPKVRPRPNRARTSTKRRLVSRR